LAALVDDLYRKMRAESPEELAEFAHLDLGR